MVYPLSLCFVPTPCTIHACTRRHLSALYPKQVRFTLLGATPPPFPTSLYFEPKTCTIHTCLVRPPPPPPHQRCTHPWSLPSLPHTPHPLSHLYLLCSENLHNTLILGAPSPHFKPKACLVHFLYVGIKDICVVLKRGLVPPIEDTLQKREGE